MDRFFTFSFLSFMVFMTIHRFKSTLFTMDKIKGKVKKAWTLYVLSIVHIFIGVIAVIEYFYLKTKINYLVTTIGLLMYFVAVLGIAWARNTLGRYHSAQIEIREGHPLITTGPYKYVRHPIYLFNVIELLGFPLIPNAYFAFLLSLFIYTPLLMLRMLIEEKVHRSIFGEDYLAYKSNVPCLIPFTKGVSKKFINLFLMEKSS